MSLSLYRKKRTFKGTPEPTGGKGSGKELRFVVQKHDASRLHYDFRLEMNGVLKSWAVPKGPSLNPADKRLAMMVEDHPYDYRDFEGIIPKGNYGAGTVIVWDEGTYESLEGGTRAEQEKELLKELKKGSVKVRMNGTKLKGEFALVKLKAKEDNAWLLIKHRDKYAKETDVTKKDKSVLSGKSITAVAKTSTTIYGKSNGKANRIAAGRSRKTASAKTPKIASTSSRNNARPKKKAPAKGTKAAFPTTIRPMLATLVDKPFDEPGWLYEIKWDGYRAVALMNRGKVDLISRNNKSFNKKFYSVYNALKEWKINAVVDGEVMVLNEKGIAHFGSLQNWRSEADGQLTFYVFDILWLNGYDLTELPLTERKGLLKENLPENDTIRLSESFETSASEFLEAASKMGMEGIMAKKADSIYFPGERTKEWLKIKANKRHEVVIGGFTQNEGSSKTFSSLLVGVYDGSRLDYIGKVGTGFNEKMQAEMMTKMKKLATTKVPFTEVPDVDKPSRFRPNPPKAKVTWLKPQLVCEVSYTEITGDGVMRHPSFEGMRTDKKAKDVKKEKAITKKEIIEKTKSPVERYTRPVMDKSRKTLLNPTDETQVRKINGHELKFTNLSKVYWPGEGYTKRDMLNYYYQVAPYILPYLKDRPQSLNRFPNGINGKSFYQKDVTASAPDWIKMEPYTTGKGEKKNFLVPEEEASILYMANAGAIEMNPWNSTIHKEDYPDWCLIDLDPSAKNSFDQVIETAQATKKVLDQLGVTGYAKTSGSTGIHIYIPLGAKYDYDQCQLFGKLVATEVHRMLPAFTSIERMTRNRKNKLYVDYLQNRPKATLAAPYSLRPKPGATVSMPLYWKEVKKGLAMKDFTIKNAIARIKSEGDIFKPVLKKGIDLDKILKKF
ncbi:MAG TPA: DNA ligase D [Chitinophagaceae bacterium]|jgi:bifunctional non-homologous end joining protein LigD|nr:DNA ligase D [Chitinophagaceae bacterium]